MQGYVTVSETWAQTVFRVAYGSRSREEMEDITAQLLMLLHASWKLTFIFSVTVAIVIFMLTLLGISEVLRQNWEEERWINSMLYVKITSGKEMSF